VSARSASAGARGFSLLEVMIAVAITAIIGALTIGAFRQVDRASEIARSQGERYAAARLALSRLAREVSMAFLSEHYDHKRFRERPTLFKGREDTLLLTTMAHERLVLDAKESDQAVVEYSVDTDPEHAGEEALFRREKARIDDEPDREGRKDLVADHVAGFRVSYWDARRKDWVREWSTRSVDHADELPGRVRFELEVKLADGRIEKFSTETRIAITRPLDF
jgi:general secretion pathway protein J